MMRWFLVYLVGMIWFGNLVSVMFMNVMYEEEEMKGGEGDGMVYGGKGVGVGGSMFRYRWFLVVMVVVCVYYFVLGFLVQFLSSFVFVIWMVFENVVVNQLFGYSIGLSLLFIMFDWMQISGFVGSFLILFWQVLFCVGVEKKGVVDEKWGQVCDSKYYDWCVDVFCVFGSDVVLQWGVVFVVFVNE